MLLVWLASQTVPFTDPVDFDSVEVGGTSASPSNASFGASVRSFVSRHISRTLFFVGATGVDALAVALSA
jgi:hypothetical protein